jgi:PIN domain nuclease of toxin-antitoxin system
MIYLDTHMVAWLYAGELELIPENIQKDISIEEIFISPVVMLELQYLFEIGRVSEEGSKVVHDLVNRIGLKVDDLPFEMVIRHAVEQKWTRDPFDRIIVAQASVHSTTLVTKDTTIHRNYQHALW